MFAAFRFRIIFLSAALLLLDLCFAPVIQVAGVRPIFSLLLIAYAAFQWESKRILPLAAAMGLARDILGGGILGVEMLAIVSCAYVMDAVAHKIEREFPGIYFILTVIFCISVLSIEFAIDWLFGKASIASGENIRIIFLCALYTGLFLPLFYQVVDFLFPPHLRPRQYELF